MNTKTFIITTTIIITFLLRPISLIKNHTEPKITENGFTTNTFYDCNSGNFGVTVTWNPSLRKFQKTSIRNSYIQYGLNTNMIPVSISNPDIEYWHFNLDNMSSGMIPPGIQCKTTVIIAKLEEDKEDGDIEEVEYATSKGDH